ncbi:MAG: AAA family ATPase, partial [Acidimicrobiia bacterium]
ASTLSLGNRQRLGLASALVHGPSVVVLDEPANTLDPAGVVFVRELLTDYAGRGAAVFVSSHHLDQLARVAHRITVLHRGRVVGALDPGGNDLEQHFFDLVHRYDLATETRR